MDESAAQLNIYPLMLNVSWNFTECTFKNDIITAVLTHSNDDKSK